MNLASLPPEILTHIVSYVRLPSSLNALSQTCKTLRPFVQPKLDSDIVLTSRHNASEYKRRCERLIGTRNGFQGARRLTLKWAGCVLLNNGAVFDLTQIKRLSRLQELRIELPPESTQVAPSHHYSWIARNLENVISANDIRFIPPLVDCYVDFGTGPGMEKWLFNGCGRLLAFPTLKRFTLVNAFIDDAVYVSSPNRHRCRLQELNLFQCIVGFNALSRLIEKATEKLEVFRFQYHKRRDPSASEPPFNRWLEMLGCLKKAQNHLKTLEIVSTGSSVKLHAPPSELDFSPFVSLSNLTVAAHLCGGSFPALLTTATYTDADQYGDLELVPEDRAFGLTANSTSGASRLKHAAEIKDNHENAIVKLKS